MKKLGLILGSGGAKAIAHLGVIKELEENNIQPKVITGASMGAVIAALYAMGKNPEECKEILVEGLKKAKLISNSKKKYKNDGLHDRKGIFGKIIKNSATAIIATTVAFKTGLKKNHPLYKTIDHIIPKNMKFEKLNIPLAVVAIDILTGKVETFSTGSLNDALKAGVTVGIVFKPYKWNEKQYIDPAPACSIPVGACIELGANVNIAVNVSTPIKNIKKVDNGLEVVRRIVEVNTNLLIENEEKKADIVLKPDIKQLFWADFSNIDEIIKKGREETKKNLDKIKNLIK